MKKIVPALILLFATHATSCAGQPDIPSSDTDDNYSLETVVSADDIAVPWGMAWLPDGAMLITNRDGELYLFNSETLSEPLSGVPEVWAQGQGGLMDIALHPDYDQNGWIYITYSSPEGGEGTNTALMRFKLNQDQSGFTDQEVLYKAEPNTEKGQHFGSRIAFDREGYLYFSIGERGNRDVNPQDITRDGGKIYRINPDGSIPEDNPFVDDEDAKAAIFTYGNRNPQGMDIHPETGDIWTHEHGPRGGDEVNRVEAGLNYGWPIISYGINYSGTEFAEDTARAGMEQPEWYWDPSIAPSGMAFVTGDNYPGWEGDLLSGSLKFDYIVRCKMDGNTITGEEIVFEDIGRVRSIEMGPDGYIYVGTEGNGIVRAVPK
jgi:glucose/arabinose dehydrogenase